MDPYSSSQEHEYPYINLAQENPRYGQLYKVLPIAGGKEEHIYMIDPDNHSTVVEAKGDNHLASEFFANGGTLIGTDNSNSAQMTPTQSIVGGTPSTPNPTINSSGTIHN